MIDLYLDKDGILRKAETDIYKGENILKIQVGSLYYAQSLGIDIRRFIDPDVKIQVETFKSYSVQELVNQGVRVETIQSKEFGFDNLIDYSIDRQPTGGIL